MIPVRISLAGFKSYRDPVTLLFAGAPLWALVGPNGVGKSAIFDAVTFVLYGTHRGRSHGLRELINHEADVLHTELDFAIGPDVFRVKRTLPRRGSPTFLAFRVAGENARPIEGTSSKGGLDVWVQQTIGLDEKTFTASVLLQQGKSEALLDADPRVRHDMLSQLVDLSAYQRLAERADDHFKELRARESFLRSRLAALAPVDDAALQVLEQEVMSLANQAAATQQRLEELIRLTDRAARWSDLQAKIAELRDQEASASRLLDRAEEIECNAARLDELEAVLPAVVRLLDVRGRLSDCETALHRARAQAQAAAEEAQAATERHRRVTATLAALRSREAAAREAERRALEMLNVLAGDMAEIGRLQDDRCELERIGAELAAFSADLDEQVAEAIAEVQRRSEVQWALPWLEHYGGARSAWQGAAARMAEATASEAAGCDRRSACVDERDRLSDEMKVAGQRTAVVRQELAAARAMHEQAVAALSRFESVDGQPVCHYCGQPLTAAHLDTERARLLGELSATQAALAAQEGRVREAATLNEGVAQAHRDAASAVDEAERALRVAEERGRQAQRDLDQQAQSALAALTQLPVAWAQRIDPSGAADMAACFSGVYPTDADLDTLQAEAAGLDEAGRWRNVLNDQRGERDQLLAQCGPVAERVARVEGRFPGPRVAQIMSQHEDAGTALAEARQILGELAEPLHAVADEETEAATAASGAAGMQQEAESLIATEGVRHAELTLALSAGLEALPASWREAGGTCTAEDVAAWHGEADRLSGARQERNALEAVRAEQAGRSPHLARLEAEAAAIPPEARRQAAELQEEAHTARVQVQQANTEREGKVRERDQLEARRAERERLESERGDAAHQAQVYRELARLLGRDQLQRYLLAQAERGIVARANEMLDRLSGGRLRLELRSAAATDGAGSAKALDLVAYDAETGRQPLPVGSLSGGQRFRVSVSLALGIGRWYAAEGARRVESVIIDEGFGSLDKEGRRQMIEELHALQGMLGRILLVSHQEEFENAFQNAYAIRLEGGTSVVSLVES